MQRRPCDVCVDEDVGIDEPAEGVPPVFSLLLPPAEVASEPRELRGIVFAAAFLAEFGILRGVELAIAAKQANVQGAALRLIGDRRVSIQFFFHRRGSDYRIGHANAVGGRGIENDERLAIRAPWKPIGFLVVAALVRVTRQRELSPVGHHAG